MAARENCSTHQVPFVSTMELNRVFHADAHRKTSRLFAERTIALTSSSVGERRAEFDSKVGFCGKNSKIKKSFLETQKIPKFKKSKNCKNP